MKSGISSPATIIPVISPPVPDPFGSRINGIGAMQFTAFISPNSDTGLIWGVGPIFQLQAFGNVVHPENGANWQLRLQVHLLLPKSLF